MMAADLLHASVHRIVPSGVSFCWPLSRCRAYSADAFALHFALSHGLHLGLHSAQPTNVQMPCREHGRSVAVAVFASALAACAAAPPGRSCREWMREANAEGKTKGGGTGPPAKPVCTWGWRGTRLLRRRAAWSARPAPMRVCPRALHDRTRQSLQGAQP